MIFWVNFYLNSAVYQICVLVCSCCFCKRLTAMANSSHSYRGAKKRELQFSFFCGVTEIRTLLTNGLLVRVPRNFRLEGNHIYS